MLMPTMLATCVPSLPLVRRPTASLRCLEPAFPRPLIHWVAPRAVGFDGVKLDGCGAVPPSLVQLGAKRRSEHVWL